MTTFGICLSSASSSSISGIAAQQHHQAQQRVARRRDAPRCQHLRFRKVVALKKFEAGPHSGVMVFPCFDFLGDRHLPLLPDNADQFGKVLARAFHKVDLDDIDARQKLEQPRRHLGNIIQCEPKARAPQVVAAPEECLVERHRFEDFEHEAFRRKRQQPYHLGHQYRPVDVQVASVIAQCGAKAHITDESRDDLRGGIGVIGDSGEIGASGAEQQFERVQCSAAGQESAAARGRRIPLWPVCRPTPVDRRREPAKGTLAFNFERFLFCQGTVQPMRRLERVPPGLCCSLG